jgi:hypothetical protein
MNKPKRTPEPAEIIMDLILALTGHRSLSTGDTKSSCRGKPRRQSKPKKWRYL